MRRLLWGVCLIILFVCTTPALAVITRLTNLSEVLEESVFIVVANVDKVDPNRPSMMLTLDESLKGKPDFKSLPVLIKGSAGAIKRKEPAQLLARVAAKIPVVIFVKKRGTEYQTLGYTNGTWFMMDGVKVDGEWRWVFTNNEPYLRRTYKGTTKEMIQTVKDALSGKKKPPTAVEKEKPGLGPTVETEKKSGSVEKEDKPRYAVIPTVLVGGPLIMLAMLFPTAFGGWKRWLVLLSTAGTTSTLYALQWYFSNSLLGSWWGSAVALWALMGVVNVLGLAWAWGRHLAQVQAGEAPGRPGRIEVIVLGIVSLIGIVALVIFRYFEQKLLSPEWLPLVAFSAAVCIGFGYTVYARLRPPSMTPAVATEAVVLTGLIVVSLVLGTVLQTQAVAAQTQKSTRETATVLWKFRLPARGGIASSPLVHSDRVYVAANHDSAFRSYGALYCLDRATGELLWTFNDNEKMKPVFSTPVVVNGKIYIGEGFHQDQDCKVYCLDAEGKKLWAFETASHTESTPTVIDGKIYIGAGDDGLYCLDAAKGTQVWNFPSFHIDAPPLVKNGRVYAGCGVGDVYKTTALFCLDAGSGTEKTPPRIVWRMNTNLPVWGKPVVSAGFVYVGTGNGRVNEAAENPAGEVMCLREADGTEVWRKKYVDGILGSLTVDRRHVYFGCRDGNLYALRRDGNLAWKVDMGAPMVSNPVIDEAEPEEMASRVYALGSGGYLVCLEARRGTTIWSMELAGLANSPVEAIATPALESRRDEKGVEVSRLYVGVTLVSTGRVGELYCLEECLREE